MHVVVPTLLGATAIVFAGVAIIAVRVVAFRRWYERETNGIAWFGRTTARKEAFARELARRGALTARVLPLLRRMLPLFPGPPNSFGLTAPPHCTDERFRFATDWQPSEQDLFVVTQMRCGTTWMQQIAHEVLLRGGGDLGDDAGRHLHTLSPWIESNWGVPIDEAPLLGERRMRVIKSHLPASLLRVHPAARYIYVTRHPAACFASTADFLSMLIGPITPGRAGLLDWFCSDAMWWGSWPDHVEGWWRASQRSRNVLFLHYEEMAADLPGTVDRVARFVGVDLSAAERREVVRKSGFAWMKEHEARFTMAAPTAFSGHGSFLRSGKASRSADVEKAERERIAAFCRERLRGASYPLARFYPDMA